MASVRSTSTEMGAVDDAAVLRCGVGLAVQCELEAVDDGALDHRQVAGQKEPILGIGVEALSVGEQHGGRVMLRVDTEADQSQPRDFLCCRNLELSHAAGDARTNRWAVREEESGHPNFSAQGLGAHRSRALIEQGKGADLAELRQRFGARLTARRQHAEREQRCAQGRSQGRTRAARSDCTRGHGPGL